MKRLYTLVTLFVGVCIGFLGGAAITIAYSNQPKVNYDQVIAQVGDTPITRSRLAEYSVQSVGENVLEGELQDIAITEEAARRAGITITQEELDKRIAETFQFAESAAVKRQMEALPRQFLEDRTRAMLVVEKLTKLTITDTEVADFFNRARQIFYTPALYKLVCIATTKKTEAVSLRNRVLAGEKAQTLSEQFSYDKKLREIKGELGWFARTMMSPMVATAIFEANDGNGLRAKQCTEVISNWNADTKTSEYLIFYVDDYSPAKRPNLDEVRPAATFYARANKYKDIAPAWFSGQQKVLDWKRVKNLFDPDAKLEPVPFNPQKYQTEPPK